MEAKFLTKEKEFPNDYTNEVIDILKLMSFSKAANVKVVGSMSLRSQLYASDLDAYELVMVNNDSKAAIVQNFKTIIYDVTNSKNLIIGDIKFGNIKGWEIISNDIKIHNKSISGYNYLDSLKKLDNLLNNHVVTHTEYEHFKKLLVVNPTPEQFIELKDEIRPNVVRWKPEDVKRGFTVLPNGEKFTLQEALDHPGVTKLDVIAYIDGKYSEISMLYEFKVNGKIINHIKKDFNESVKEDILDYCINENYFKMAKRMFSLVKFEKNDIDIVKLGELFNSDLGRLYSVSSDVKVLIFLLENVKDISFERIQHEVDQFKSRLSNIYSLPKWYNVKNKVDNIINYLVKIKTTPNKTRIYIHELKELDNFMMDNLNYYTIERLKGLHLWPLPAKYQL